MTEDQSDMIQDLIPKVTRGQISEYHYLTETVWNYAMAMKRCLLAEMLSMTDTMGRILGMRDSYLAMTD